MNYNETICTAIDTIIAQRLSELAYDKTVQAIIVDDSKKEYGVYTVQEGSAQYEVHSNETKYTKDSKVYVQIPLGDYSAQKTIISKVDAEQSSKPLSYVSPMDSFIKDESQSYFFEEGASLIANGESTESRLPITDKELSGANKDYNAIAIKASFRALLNGVDKIVSTGTYGLRIELRTDENEVVSVELENTKDFFGDTYNFNSYIPQEQVYSLPKNKRFKSLSCILYQKKDFNYSDGSVVIASEQSNIFVSNVYVTLGYNVATFEDNKVKIYADRDEKGAYPFSDNSTKVNLELIWFNKDDNNKYIGFNDNNENQQYNITWYRESIVGNAVSIAAGGVEKTSIEAEIDLQAAQSTFYAVISYGEEKFTSNKITYRNVKNAEAETIVKDYTLSLEIAHAADGDLPSKDHYALYANNGYIINNGESSKNRKVGGVKAISANEKETYTSEFFYGGKVYWKIPKYGSMLRAPFLSENSQWKLVENGSEYDENYYTYSDNPVSDNYKLEQLRFPYRIADYLQESDANNIITCVIMSEDGKRFTGQKSFSFSRAETMGLGYRVEFHFKDADGYNYPGYISNMDSLPVQIKVFDRGGNEITNHDSITISLKWENDNNKLADNCGVIGSVAGDKGSFSIAGDVWGHYSVLKAEVTVSASGTDSNPITMYEYWPLASIRGGIYNGQVKNDHYYAEIPSRLIYDNTGTKLYNTQLSIILYGVSNKTVSVYNSLEYVKVNYYSDGWKTSGNAFIPKVVTNNKLLRQDKDATVYELKLVPYPTYVQGLERVAIEISNGANHFWWQPLIIEQDRYGSSILNSWDGNFKLDKKNGTIMSTAIAAGKKDINNTYSGVIMGQIDSIDNGITTSGKMGLYGYNQGDQTFGIDVDGTAFLGKSGGGRIWASGDAGIIASNSWIKDYKTLQVKSDLASGETGTLINLKDGSIKMINNGGGSHFKFDNNGLDIKVDKFSLASGGSVGGPNMLKNTEPVEEDGENITHDWVIPSASSAGSMTAVKDGDKKVIKIKSSSGATTYKLIAQPINVKKDTKYTLSGQVKFSSSNVTKLSVKQDSKWLDIIKNDNKGEYQYFAKTFTATQTGEENFNIGLCLSDNSGTFKDDYLYLYHLKLEEGPVATAWGSNGGDTEVKIAISKDGILQEVSKNLEDNYYTSSVIDQKAESITQEVYSTVKSNYYAISTDSATATRNYKTVTITPTLTDFTKVFQTGVIVAATFSNKNTYTDGTLYLNISVASDEMPDIAPLPYGYPIYFNGEITSATNQFLWEDNSTIMFMFNEDGGKNNNLNTGYWSVVDNGSYSKIIQTANSITSKVDDLDGRMSVVEQTAEGITSTVLSGGLYCITNSNATLKEDTSTEGSPGHFFCYVQGSVKEDIEKTGDANLSKWKTGDKIAVQFTGTKNAKTQDAKAIVLRWGRPGDFNKSASYPIYVDGEKTGNTKNGKVVTFDWTQNSVVFFTLYKKGDIIQSSQSGKVIEETHWELSDNGSYSQLQQTADQIAAKVSNTSSGEGCSWALTENGFYVAQGNEKVVNNAIENYVMKVDKSGLTVKGRIEATGGSLNINNNFIVDTSGNVTLNGNITWGTGASPTQAVYASYSSSGGVPTKPANGKNYSSFPASSTAGTWHQILDTANDKFTSYTYDGGKTWGNVVQIVGKDGANGTNGKDGTNGTNGKDGAKGDTIQIKQAFYRSNSATPPTTKPSGSSYPTGWTTTASGVTSSQKYEYISQCTVTNSTYGTWSSPVLFARYGSDGANGTNGSDATVNAINVFNALTSDGTKFGCFNSTDNKLYINAEYLNTGILRVGNKNAEVFFADINNEKVEIGGWTVDSKNSLHTENNALYLGTSGISSSIGGVSRSGLVFKAGSNFGVTSAGNLYAHGVDLTGTIKATGGTIGGWYIGTNLLVSNSNGNTDKNMLYLASSSASGYGNWMVAKDDNGGVPFKVSREGILSATDAIISGTITATGGKIGPLSVADSGKELKVDISKETVVNTKKIIIPVNKPPNGTSVITYTIQLEPIDSNRFTRQVYLMSGSPSTTTLWAFPNNDVTLNWTYQGGETDLDEYYLGKDVNNSNIKAKILDNNKIEIYITVQADYKPNEADTKAPRGYFTIENFTYYILTGPDLLIREEEVILGKTYIGNLSSPTIDALKSRIEFLEKSFK